MNKYLLSLTLSFVLHFGLLAQDTSYFQIKRNITLGFQTGVQFNNYPNQYQNSKVTQYTNRLLARKKITRHFDMETGINYAVVPMGNSVINPTSRYRTQTNQLSIPLTIQYNFLPETKKIRPYIAAGGIYDLIRINYPIKQAAYTDANMPVVQNNKSVGAMVSQGVIFEVNTKIQFNECIHFIQEGKSKSLGIDLGIGYKL